MASMRAALEAEVQRLSEDETQITNQLDVMLKKLADGRYIQDSGASSNDLSSSIQKIDNFMPCFEAMESGSSKLATQLQDCRGLSDRLSTLVRRLDTIQSSAQRALACAEDITSMKDYKSGLQEAMVAKKLSKAVNFVRLVNDMDEDTAKAADEYEDVKMLEADLKVVVKEEFSRAIAGSSVDEVLVLCPLLQSLGLEQSARDDFLSFIEANAFIAISADAVSGDDASDASTAYAQSLSNVFNTASLILQQYLPGVIQGLEKADGDTHFIRRLHAQTEKEASTVLKRYIKYRKIKAIIASLQADAEPLANMAEMHVILDELALLLQYCCMYRAYLSSLCASAESRRPGREGVFPGPTNFDHMVDELCTRYYIEGERWLIKRGVAAGLQQLDECYFVLQRCGLRAAATNNINASVTVMHLITDLISADLRRSVTEQLASAVSRAAAAAHTSIAGAVRDKAGPSGAGAGGDNSLDLDASLRSVLGLQSTTGASTGDAVNMNLGEAFNVVGKCTRYTERLSRDVSDACDSVYTNQPAVSADDLERMKTCHAAFTATSASYAGILRKGAAVLSSKVQPVVQLILSHFLDRRGAMGGVRFELADDAFEMQPAVALLPHSLISLFGMLLEICTKDLSEAHVNVVVHDLASTVCEKVEHLINQTSFSFSGALKFEECVRALQSLFLRRAEGGAVRSTFSRLREILMVLTADVGDGITHSGGLNSFSHITTNEARAFASLRVNK